MTAFKRPVVGSASHVREVFRASSTEYGQPLRVDEHTTVLPVSRRSARGKETAVGLFTIADGKATWTPVVDGGRVALIGVLTGLVAATLGSAAVFKQPPWPSFTVDRWKHELTR